MKLIRKWLTSIAKRLFWKEHQQNAIKQIESTRNELVSRDMFIVAPLLFKGEGYFRSMEAKQNLSEFLPLADALDKITLDNVCEIGTHKGGTLFIWCQLAAPDANVFSIDLPGGDFGGGYTARSVPFFQSFKKPGQQLHLLRGNSHSSEMKKEFTDKLNGQKLDFILIDGDHTYDGVKQDFDDYAGFVREGGIIAFHDIVVRPEYPHIEVWRFWDEIKEKYKYEEFIETGTSRRTIGIGMIYQNSSSITE